MLFGVAASVLLAWAGCGQNESASAPPPVVSEAPIAEPVSVPPPRKTELDLAEAASDPLGKHFEARYPASLESVIERRFLRVLTSRNNFDFFISDGGRGGYQYEMVSAFTKFLNERHLKGKGELSIQFELVPVDDDQLMPLLLEGAGDIIAARLTITPNRAERVRFTRPYRKVDEQIVFHDGIAAITSLHDLSGKQVAVRTTSSYAESLARLNLELVKEGRAPVDVVFVDDALATERILELVAARKYAFTVADSLIAELAVRMYPSLRVAEGLALRRGGELAWATVPEASMLADEMNTFLRRYREGSLLGNLAARRYFEDEARLASRVDGERSVISEFDALFREHAKAYGLDWRLVAAMAYQESRFDPTARNRSGATGLLQIKLQTAREPYIGIPDIAGKENVSNNVRAGLKYLDWIKRRYFDSESEMRDRDRLRMALAAYNAGPAVVIRARNRAKEQGRNPNRWFRHVELSMLGMRKNEPVKYVSEINQRYLSYVLLGIK
jgi:membrane-bound lytic murein transglycosylase MltF